MLIALFATNRSIEFDNTFTSKWGIDGQLRWRPKSAKWGPLVCVYVCVCGGGGGEGEGECITLVWNSKLVILHTEK